jgi:hypothetical protein
MNELFTFTLAIILITFSLLPGFIVLGALFPTRLAQTQANAARWPGRSFLVGMVNFIFFLVTTLVLLALVERTAGLLRTILTLPALVIATVLLVMISFGLAGVARLIGERLAPAQSAWRQLFWGTLLLGLGCSVPLAGWFLLLFYAGWVGMGAFVISFFQKPAI